MGINPFSVVRGTLAVQPIPLLEQSAPHVRDATANLLAAIQRDQGYTVTFDTARQVPAYVKALKTYGHTIGAFPLREYVNGAEIVARPFLNQPSRNTTYAAEIMRLVFDVLNYDHAWWRVVERTWDGYPAAIVRMPADEVQEFDGQVQWNGTPVPLRDVMRFDGDGLGGWLTTGASVINTAAALEAACLRYAEYPMPNLALKNNGADLPAAVVDDLLEAWESARTNRATAYLNSTIDIKEMGWNASDLQLTDARQAAAAQVARMANLDPIWCGAGIPGSSLTYANRTDLYRQLLDLALTPVMDLIAQRLSMNDVTPRGHTVKFDTTKFLRQNITDLSGIIKELGPLGYISVEEARALLDLPALGITTTPPPTIRSL